MDPLRNVGSSSSRDQLIAHDGPADTPGAPSTEGPRSKSGRAEERVLETMETPTSPAHEGPRGTPTYRTYKRRWFGLVQLILLNIVVSWGWLTYAPVANTAASFFETTPGAISWLAVGIFFAFVAAAPVSHYALRRGPKPAMTAASALLLLGSWIRYGATRASPKPSFAGTMVGQVLIGFAQPFVLAAPTRYSDLWFSARGRIAATAITTLANPFGAALAQLINPFLVDTNAPGTIAPLSLYVAIITTVASVPTPFVPAAPPVPVSAATHSPHPPLRTQLRLLARNPTAALTLLPFAVYVGLFNSFSSLLTPILTPHGYSESDAGIAGAVLILAGLVATLVFAPVLDRTKAYLLTIKILLPLAAAGYLAFVWVPQAPTIAAADVVCASIGVASFLLLPTALEFLVEACWPVGPELTSVLAWSGGQLFGAIFTIVSVALQDGPDASPPWDMRRALIFQAVVAIAVLPSAFALGWVGDARSKRTDAERAEREA